MRNKMAALFLLLGILAFPFQSISALPRADVRNDQVKFDFPTTATFSATLTANANITSVILEYGDNQLTCGDVIAKAYPQFEPGKNIQAEWTWDMRQSGSLPPGAQIWWRWRYKDESGAEFVSEQQTATWLDNIHSWQTITSGDLRVHWYANDRTFAQTMLDAGVEGLRRNREQAGLVSEAPMDIYIYSNYEDMQNAILFEPSWTGGMAYSEHNIFIMGMSSADMDWNTKTVIHELTHILVGHFTFSCIGLLPTWLSEGLAMYSEGDLSADMQSQLDQAISSNTLLTVRSLSSNFSELTDKANLSYSQSQSIVKFLITAHGQEKMTELLIALRDAKPIDAALTQVYGFDTDGLEDAWRKAVNAAPRAVSALPTAQPTPTFVPTYVPFSGVPLLVTPTPYVVPTSSSSPNNAPSPFKDPTFIGLTVILLCVCVAMLLVVGVFVLGFIVRRNNAKAQGVNHE